MDLTLGRSDTPNTPRARGSETVGSEGSRVKNCLRTGPALEVVAVKIVEGGASPRAPRARAPRARAPRVQGVDAHGLELRDGARDLAEGDLVVDAVYEALGFDDGVAELGFDVGVAELVECELRVRESSSR